jgi:hypothetical protein
MDEEILYPVCPHRNVPAAFQRFLGPDSGGIERFFPCERIKKRHLAEEFSKELRYVFLIVSDAAILVRAVLAVGGAIAASSAQELVFWRSSAPRSQSPRSAAAS